MNFLVQILIGGISAGAIYSLIAVGFSITYTTTKTINFALGMWVMLGAMLTFTLHTTHGAALLPTLLLVGATCFLLGWIVERIAVYPFIQAKTDLWVMSTLAIGLLLIDFSELIWGRGQHLVQPFFSSPVLRMGSFTVQTQQLLSIGAVVFIYIALDFCFRFTLFGKCLRAVAQDRQASALMGINVRRIESSSFALSTLFAGLAGFLLVPITGAEPHMGTGIGFKAFAVAVVGGLSSPRGILVFGLAFGMIEGVIAGYLHSGLRDILGFSLMIATLALRPQGILGKPEAARP